MGIAERKCREVEAGAGCMWGISQEMSVSASLMTSSTSMDGSGTSASKAVVTAQPSPSLSMRIPVMLRTQSGVVMAMTLTASAFALRWLDALLAKVVTVVVKEVLEDDSSIVSLLQGCQGARAGRT